MNTGVSCAPKLVVDCGGERSLTSWYAAQSSAPELRSHVDQVAERPEPFVREPTVVRVVQRAIDPEAAQLVRRAVGRHAHACRRRRPPRDRPCRRRARSTRRPARASAHRARRRRRRLRAPRDAARARRSCAGTVHGSRPRSAAAARRSSISPARARPRRKSDRPDQFVDRDERHEQQLHVVRPSPEIPPRDRRESERDAGLRDQPGPRRTRRCAGSSPDAPQARATPRRISASRTSDERDRDVPDRDQRVELQRGADRRRRRRRAPAARRAESPPSAHRPAAPRRSG